MELFEGIYSRRSIRHFSKSPVKEDNLMEVIKAGTWAPSGLNNQPWRFVVITDPATQENLAKMTKYGRIIREAPACIAVFTDHEAMYNETKDHQAIGACLQNMLLAAHGQGLGAVWLGEILNNAEKVRSLLDLPESLELMAIIALGHPSQPPGNSDRRGLSEVIVKKI
ncbi:MAG: nitroreductase [Thermodesulfovibrionales bacterium]|nr:nitroreductase [Thermodesulfovibrionales bacterium]